MVSRHVIGICGILDQSMCMLMGSAQSVLKGGVSFLVMFQPTGTVVCHERVRLSNIKSSQVFGYLMRSSLYSAALIVSLTQPVYFVCHVP
jgi:hypothetical protein